MELQAALNEFILDRRSFGRRPATIRFYQTHLGALIGFLENRDQAEVTSLTRSSMRAWFAHLQTRVERREIQSGTVAAYDRAIRAFTRFCVAERWLDVDPMAGRPRIKPDRKLPDTWSLAEVQALLDTCDGSPVGLRDRAMMMLLLDTGLRAGELVSLAQADVHLGEDRGWVVVRASGSKSHADRTVAIWSATVEALQDWIEVRPELADTMFVAVDGRATLTRRSLTPNGLNQLLRRRVVLAGVECKPRLCHIWRHTFARLYVAKGGDIQTLRLMLGHASIETTQVYLAFRNDEIWDKHFELSPVRQLLTMTR